MTAVALTIFNGCQKEELNIDQLVDDVQPQLEVKPDVYVENGYLVFKNQAIFDSVLCHVQNMNELDFEKWEKSLGFISANTYLLKAEEEFSRIKSEDQFNSFYNKHNRNLIIQKEPKQIDFIFYSRSLSQLLNIQGVFKISQSLYYFTDVKEYIILNGNNDVLKQIQKSKGIDYSNEKELIVFNPNESTQLKSTSEFLAGGFVYTDYRWADYGTGEWTAFKRLNYTFERTLFASVHSFDPYTGVTRYACGYKLFFRMKQYHNEHGTWKSDKISYWVKDQYIKFKGLVDGQVVQSFDNVVANRSFSSTSNSVYVYYADKSFITTNPNAIDLIVESYSATFRSNRLHAEGCASCIFWETITY